MSFLQKSSGGLAGGTYYEEKKFKPSLWLVLILITLIGGYLWYRFSKPVIDFPDCLTFELRSKGGGNFKDHYRIDFDEDNVAYRVVNNNSKIKGSFEIKQKNKTKLIVKFGGDEYIFELKNEDKWVLIIPDDAEAKDCSGTTPNTNSRDNTNTQSPTTIEQPNIKIVYEPNQNRVPAAIHLKTNVEDENNYSFMWDFGDGKTSTEKRPIHTFTISGNNKVSLTIGKNGQFNTINQFIKIQESIYSLSFTKVEVHIPDIVPDAGGTKNDPLVTICSKEGVKRRECGYSNVETDKNDCILNINHDFVIDNGLEILLQEEDLGFKLNKTFELLASFSVSADKIRQAYAKEEDNVILINNDNGIKIKVFFNRNSINIIEKPDNE
jgi:PKD domain